MNDHRIRYRKRGHSSIWIEHCSATHPDYYDSGGWFYNWNTAYWQVIMAADEGANKTLFRVRGGRALEACKSLQWSENVKSSKDDADCQWQDVFGTNLVLQKDAKKQVKSLQITRIFPQITRPSN